MTAEQLDTVQACLMLATLKYSLGRESVVGTHASVTLAHETSKTLVKQLTQAVLSQDTQTHQ